MTIVTFQSTATRIRSYPHCCVNRTITSSLFNPLLLRRRVIHHSRALSLNPHALVIHCSRHSDMKWTLSIVDSIEYSKPLGLLFLIASLINLINSITINCFLASTISSLRHFITILIRWWIYQISITILTILWHFQCDCCCYWKMDTIEMDTNRLGNTSARRCQSYSNRIYTKITVNFLHLLHFFSFHFFSFRKS